RSPMEERWGGWYVTGTSGDQRHLGNKVMDDEGRFDREAGCNTTDLKGRVDTAPYLSPHSDIVALMVLAHQTYVQNQMIQAAYKLRAKGNVPQKSGASGVHDP